jgi:hypothetical protein
MENVWDGIRKGLWPNDEMNGFKVDEDDWRSRCKEVERVYNAEHLAMSVGTRSATRIDGSGRFDKAWVEFADEYTPWTVAELGCKTQAEADSWLVKVGKDREARNMEL